MISFNSQYRIQVTSVNPLSHRTERNTVSLWRTTFSFLAPFPDQIRVVWVFFRKFQNHLQLCAKYTYAVKQNNSVKTQQIEHLHFFSNCSWTVLSWPCYLLSRAKFYVHNEPLQDQGDTPEDRNDLLWGDTLKMAYKIRVKSNEDNFMLLRMTL